jgi:hypothetical protein
LETNGIYGGLFKYLSIIPVIMNTKASSNKTGAKKIDTGKSKSSGEELKTEGPLSEKDEVKKAEERTRKHMKGK